MSFGGAKLLSCIVLVDVQSLAAAATALRNDLIENSCLSNGTFGKFWSMAAAVVRAVLDSCSQKAAFVKGSKSSNAPKWLMFNQSIPVWLSLLLEIMGRLCSAKCPWAADGGNWWKPDPSTGTVSDYESLDEEYGLKCRVLIYHSFSSSRNSCSQVFSLQWCSRR